MARCKHLSGVLCAWLTVVTLVPGYLLFSGKYVLVKQENQVVKQENHVVARQVLGGGTASPSELELNRFKRGIHVAESSIGLLQDAENKEDMGKVGLIGSKAIQDEIQKTFSVSKDGSTNSRAAFEQVVALSSLLPKISNISRIKTPSPEAFRDYIAPMGLPVIFTDMLEGTKLEAWSWEYVRAKWGHVVYHNTRQGDYSTKTSKQGKHYINRVSVKLSDFIDIVTGNKAPSKEEEGMYITKQRVIPVEALEQEFSYPEFYPGSHKKCYLEPTGWIGAPGTFTQGHIDSKDNFVYQIIGEKRWTIFSPQDYKYLYYTETKGSLEWSAVLNTYDLKDIDLTKYPQFSKTTPITFTMQPGEVLYLPRGWTHTVANVSPALMINTWRYGPAAITEYWSNKNRDEIRKRCFLRQ